LLSQLSKEQINVINFSQDCMPSENTLRFSRATLDKLGYNIVCINASNVTGIPNVSLTNTGSENQKALQISNLSLPQVRFKLTSAQINNFDGKRMSKFLSMTDDDKNFFRVLTGANLSQVFRRCQVLSNTTAFSYVNNLNSMLNTLAPEQWSDIDLTNAPNHIFAVMRESLSEFTENALETMTVGQRHTIPYENFHYYIRLNQLAAIDDIANITFTPRKVKAFRAFNKEQLKQYLTDEAPNAAKLKEIYCGLTKTQRGYGLISIPMITTNENGDVAYTFNPDA
jgi:hypothetical protein